MQPPHGINPITQCVMSRLPPHATPQIILPLRNLNVTQRWFHNRTAILRYVSRHQGNHAHQPNSLHPRNNDARWRQGCF
jgi:hypothetical protein